MAGMTDPRTAGQPSPEEMRAYLEQLREADAGGLLAEAFNLLATGAQVKLGRPDARSLIDGLAGMVQGAQAVLPAELVEQMNQGIAQLQMAQVQAERDAEAAQGTDAPDGGAQADQPTTSSPPQPGGAPRGAPPGGGAPGQAGGNKRMTDRLWVPGRDPRPPGTAPR